MAKKIRKTTKVRKDIKEFLLSEEGKITKKDIAKIGTGLALVSMLFAPESAPAAHANSFYTTGQGGHVSHSSHGSHASHASHGSY